MAGYDSDPFVKLRKKIFGEDKKKAVDDSQESAMKKGGKVSSASKRADGCAIRGKTRA